ncbi:MAG: hypothetical protein ABI791_05335 [Acidobacteriota bacterium]
MKRFIFSILCVAVFFVGLGALVDNVGARFKSDEKALTLIKQARVAIGGDQAIAGVRSMTISGKTTRTVRTESGETVDIGEQELAMQLPDKLMKTLKFGNADGTAGGEGIKQLDVFVTRSDNAPSEIVRDDIEGGGANGAVRKIVIKKGDGTTEEVTGDAQHKIIVRHPGDAELPMKIATDGGDGKQVIIRREHATEHGAARQNELLRTTLALFLSAPEGIDVNYTFAGEADVDGTACNQVNAEFAGSIIKLFLSKATSLPVMMSYTGHSMPMMFKVRTKAPEGVDASKDVMVFKRGVEGGPVGEMAEFQVRFADYRGVGGVQLPYKWTTSTGGTTTEVFEVTAYDINPANIADRFKHEKVLVRMPKESQ